MEQMEFYDSLPRVACLAALELENLAQDANAPLEHVERFIALLNGNMNIDVSNSYHHPKNVDLSAIDPLTGYAVRQALRKSVAEQHIADVDSLLNTIQQRITTPLQELLASTSGGKKHTKEEIGALSIICLSIAQIYSSFERKHDKLENNPFR